jgi:hypothetical protein
MSVICLQDRAQEAFRPCGLPRTILTKDHQLSGLLNSTADQYSNLSGTELISSKVSELVIMGGEYPSGYEYNFWGDNASLAAHVVNNWEGRVVFSGTELGGDVRSGGRFMSEGPPGDPVRAAYVWYTYNNSRFSWDPLTVLYAIHGLGELFEYGNQAGHNHVLSNGSNIWVWDETIRDHHWLKLKVDNTTAGAELDRLMLEGAWSTVTRQQSWHDGSEDQVHKEL